MQCFGHSLALPFFGIEMKTDIFQSYGSLLFSKFAGILRAAFSQHHHLVSERSAGISSPPLAFFTVMLP